VTSGKIVAVVVSRRCTTSLSRIRARMRKQNGPCVLLSLSRAYILTNANHERGILVYARVRSTNYSREIFHFPDDAARFAKSVEIR